MTYRFIRDYSSEFPVKKMCQVLKVSRSGYYAWQKCPESRRKKANKKLLEGISRIRENKHYRSYGSPRMTLELREQGYACGKNRVATLMRLHGIRAKAARRFKATTNSEHSYPVAENLLKQDFTVKVANEAWVSDITYIGTGEGWLYLCVVLDLYSRQVVGWSTSERNDCAFVLRAIDRAITRRHGVQGVVFHSDRGVQYACQETRKQLARAGFIRSMSGRGNCYDNAPSESFMHTIKVELIYDENYKTRKEAHTAIFDYIELFYNRQRKHSSLGYLSPVQYEQLSKIAA